VRNRYAGDTAGQLFSVKTILPLAPYELFSAKTILPSLAGSGTHNGRQIFFLENILPATSHAGARAIPAPKAMIFGQVGKEWPIPAGVRKGSITAGWLHEQQA
jgi:hypothetical protein